MATPGDVLKLVKDEGVEVVDVRFCDLPGLMQHFSIPAHELTEDVFEDGLGFDGSSIRGFQEIHESDMLLIPDPSTAVIDPFRAAHDAEHQRASCSDPVTGERYSRDPRYIAKKAEDYLKRHRPRRHRVLRARGRVLHLRLGALRPEPVLGLLLPRLGRGRVELGPRAELDGSPNLGYKPRYKEGYFPVPPMDQFQDLRSEMVRDARAGRHRDRGAAPRGRHRRPGRDRHALRHARASMADKLMLYKYVVKNVARAARQLGHVHAEADLPGQRLGHARAPVALEGRRAAVLRREGLRRALGHGALVHRRAAQARAGAAARSRTRPPTRTSGSCPGYEAPVNLVYSQRNRSASVRIPLYSKSPKAKRLEFRCPDPSLQPVPRVLRDADGRPRRHPEPHRAADAGRPGPLRPPARGAGEGAAGAGLARRGARRARGRPRVPARRATCSRPT